MVGFARWLVLAAFWTTSLSASQVAASATSGGSQTSRVNITYSKVRTCPHRTYNCITHTLAQQCLRTSRTLNGTTPSTAEGEAQALSTIETTTHESQAPPTVISAGSDTAEPTHPISTVVALPADGAQADHATDSKPTATQTSTDSAQPPKEADQDTDSPLDNAHFLSFEEWKKQNLAKAGQSSDQVGERRAIEHSAETRRRPINNALDTFGDEGEIDLDFGDFVTGNGQEQHLSGQHKAKPGRNTEPSGANTDEDDLEAFGAHQKGQLAGKTSKDRFNYASFDCAAMILKTNPECKGSSSVLVENKDSYMLTECSVKNKFVIVELCEDILVDTVVLANFEFFSSIFRTFRVSVSGTYPVKMDRWKVLGTFEGHNRRDIQAFAIDNPLIWARYLRIEFLTHFGNEYYCPLSLLRIHGTTMMEEFKNQGDSARTEDEVEDSTAVVPVSDPEPPEPVQAVEIMPTVPEETKATFDELELPIDTDSPIIPVFPPKPLPFSPSSHNRSELSRTAMLQLQAIMTNSSLLCNLSFPPDRVASDPSPVIVSSHKIPEISPDTTKIQPTPKTETTVRKPASTISPDLKPKVKNGTAASTPNSQKASSNNTEGSRIAPSATGPPAAMPTTQESFFKTIHKRLQLLEANSTLSLLYIEEQSRILREAFTKVEKKQMAKATAFLDNLNATILTEIRGYLYDQIFQSTVIELESQRERSDRELLAVSSRLSLLADEMLLQKRLSIAQAVLMLLCLGFVIFSRSNAAASYLEVPMLQTMLSRSQSSFRLPFESPPNSPSSTRPNSSRQDSRPFTFGRQRSHRSDSSMDESSTPRRSDSSRTPNLEFSPLKRESTEEGTQESSPERNNYRQEKENSSSVSSDSSRQPGRESPERRLADPWRMAQTRSGPSTPTGTRREKRRLNGAVLNNGKSPLRWINHPDDTAIAVDPSVDNPDDLEESYTDTDIDTHATAQRHKYLTPPAE